MEENEQKPVESTPKAQIPEAQSQAPEPVIPERIVEQSIVMSVKNNAHIQENKSTIGRGTPEE